MYYRVLLPGLALIVWPFFLLAQLTIKVTSIPLNTPPNSTIYIAGSFNNWNSGSPAHTLSANGDGTYQITLSIPAGAIEYKFTRGSWATVEGNTNGGYLPNRTYQYAGGAQTLEVQIHSWEDVGGANSTAADNVTVISNEFYMPQLNRYRRVWVYLPPDYDSSGKRYPVLYMQDGQNVFDEATSFSGEWEVDESLNELFDNGDGGIIVVAIDNGGVNRINEYSPWVHPTYGGGQGDAYVDFMIETLKPHIDEHFRTLPDRLHTGVMGSSMGGLISLYAAIEHQDVFGKAGIFSPAFWFSNQCYTHVSSTGKDADMRIYLMAGVPEDNGSVVEDLNTMYVTLDNSGFNTNELFLETPSDGQHSEWFWAREFPDAYQWLFAGSGAVSTTGPDGGQVRYLLSPNPTDSVVYLSGSLTLKRPRWQAFTADGREALRLSSIKNNTLDLSGLPAGVYVIVIFDGKKAVAAEKVVVRP